MRPRFRYNPKDGGTLDALNEEAIILLTKWIRDRQVNKSQKRTEFIEARQVE